MKQFTLLLVLFSSLMARAQFSNLVVYTEMGERFTLALNGIMQNQMPGNNIRLTGLNPGNYQMAMIFEVPALGTVQWNLIVEPSSEATYCARRLQSGEWMVRLLSIVPTAQVVQTIVPNQSTIIYHTSPLPGSVPGSYYTEDYYPEDQIQLNMGINGGGINLNVGGNYSGPNTTNNWVSPGYQQTTVQTTIYPGQVLPVQPAQPAPPPVVYPNNACGFAMDPVSFSNARSSISTKNFESSKLQVARQITQSNCLTCTQVREIMGLFSFESSKLEFAKFAFPFTVDPNNYYLVNDSFGFSSSIDDLNRFLQNRR